MNTNFYPTHGMDLDENGEWVRVPIENVIPKWLYESYCEDENEDEEIVSVVPYLENEFRKWLMDKRGISSKSADAYIRAYESAYESLYDIVQLDLSHLLHSYLVSIPEETKCDLTISFAPEVVEIYVETMLEELDENEDAYTKAELRAMTTYHAFIADITGASVKTFIKEKSSSLPDEEEFRSWLETECGMDYENARKTVSSVKRMDVVVPSLVSEPMTFLDVLRALPAGSKRKNYIKLLRTKKKEIYRKSGWSYKTILNGFANLTFYLNFLNSKNISK